MFPFDYQNKIKINPSHQTDLKDLQQQLLTKAAEELQRVKARDITIKGHNVSYRVGLLRFVDRSSILYIIDRGHIEVLISDKSLTISYFISFKIFFILTTLLFVISEIVVLIIWDLSVIDQILLFILTWLLIVGLNWAITIIRFSYFIRRIIREVK